MWVRIKELTYTGRKDKPFAQPGDEVNLRKDVAERLISSGIAEEKVSEAQVPATSDKVKED